MFRLIMLFSLCLLSACMGTKIEVDNKLHFDQQRYQSYAWTNEPMEDPSGRQDVMYRGDGILRKLVNEQLQERGYQSVARDAADFLVDYRFIRTMQTDKGGIISPTDEAAAAWDIGADVNNTQLHNHSVNAYVMHSQMKVVLTDPKGDALWRARASKLMDNESPSDDALHHTLSKITRKMFSGFPEAE